MTNRPQVAIDAEELQRELLKLIHNNDLASVAASAMVQATYAQQCGEAILQLLRHKNIVSEADIQTALANAYHARAHKLKQSGAVVINGAPMIRPGGSF